MCCRTGKRKGLKPKPAVLKRQKMKPGEKLPAEEMERRLGYLNRMARGELESGDDDDDSDTSDSGSESDGDGSGSEGHLGEKGARKSREEAKAKEGAKVPQDLVPATEVEGKCVRLAVCDLDWDHLGAVDLVRLFGCACLEALTRSVEGPKQWGTMGAGRRFGGL